MSKKKDLIDYETGEIKKTISESDFNKLIVIESRRSSNDTLRVQLDYSNCPSMAEQHTAHLSDINYLMEVMQPDALAQYIAARSAQKTPLPDLNDGYDHSQEHDLQGAKNAVYQAKQAFYDLPEDLQMQFRSPLEFYKFIDNPANQEKMIKLGLLTKKEVQTLTTQEDKNKPSSTQPSPSPSPTSSPSSTP